MTIGNAKHATAVVKHWLSHRDDYYEGNDTDEISFLGHGAYRAAFLHIATQVVYKVGSARMAEAEVESSKTFRQMVWQGVYVPKMDLHTVKTKGREAQVVVAVEYLDFPLAFYSNGDTMCKAALQEWIRKEGSGDMHTKNFLNASGIMIPIDLGDW